MLIKFKMLKFEKRASLGTLRHWWKEGRVPVDCAQKMTVHISLVLHRYGFLHYVPMIACKIIWISVEINPMQTSHSEPWGLNIEVVNWWGLTSFPAKELATSMKSTEAMIQRAFILKDVPSRLSRKLRGKLF